MGKIDFDAREIKWRIARAREVWTESKPAQGSVVETFMASRGFSPSEMPEVLQFHQKLWNAECARPIPAMICGIWRGGFITAVHCTFLKKDGKGIAPLKKPRIVIGHYIGAHAQFDVIVRGNLVLTDCIETALQFKRRAPAVPIYSSIRIENISAPVPKAVDKLILLTRGRKSDASDEILSCAAATHAARGHSVRIERLAL